MSGQASGQAAARGHGAEHDPGTGHHLGAGQDSGAGRDRDASGRPRNARPRDGLGRPLARGTAGEAGLPEDLSLPPAQAARLAQDLIDAGRPFHAHEVLEAAWKAAPGSERSLWRGLAQVAVGLTHARRGNARGAVSLLRRGAASIGEHHGAVPAGLDPDAAAQAALRLADLIQAGGLRQAGDLGQAGGDARLRLRLTLPG